MRRMKKIITIVSILAGVLTMASCSMKEDPDAIVSP